MDKTSEHRSASRRCGTCAACEVGIRTPYECRSGPPSSEGWNPVPADGWCLDWEARDPIHGTFGGLIEGVAVWLEEAPTAGTKWGKRHGRAVPPTPDPSWQLVATFRVDQSTASEVEFWQRAQGEELWCVAELGGSMVGVEIGDELEDKGDDDGQEQAEDAHG